MPTYQPLSLVSYAICPFVQRATLLLEQQNRPYKITYIDLKDKPDWFLAISPMGKVPVLTVGEKGQETTLFESHVILEFLNETSTTNLHPADPVQKARHRAVMEFGSGMIGNSWMLMIAKDQDSFITHKGALLQNLNQLETMHKAAGAGPYFAGEALHLLDISFAPLLQRLHILQNHFVPDLWQHAPTVKAWWDALNALPAMARSAIPDLETQILDRLHQENSFITTQATA